MNKTNCQHIGCHSSVSTEPSLTTTDRSEVWRYHPKKQQQKDFEFQGVIWESTEWVKSASFYLVVLPVLHFLLFLLFCNRNAMTALHFTSMLLFKSCSYWIENQKSPLLPCMAASYSCLWLSVKHKSLTRQITSATSSWKVATLAYVILPSGYSTSTTHPWPFGNCSTRLRWIPCYLVLCWSLFLFCNWQWLFWWRFWWWR